MKTRTYLLGLLTMVSAVANAGCFHDGATVDLRLGYTIGGTMPLGMPATIRCLNSYRIMFNPQIAATVNFPITDVWGIETGLKAERKSMRTDAGVKGYHMEMTQGEESIEGLFTGNVVTEYSSWGFTVPVQASCRVCRTVKLRFGPYVSLLFNHDFNGYAYDGYIRKDTPTGEKVEIGSTEDTRGDYSFADDVRPVQLGLDLGVDWRLWKSMGVYADVQWGVTGAFKSSFKTIEQTMYPIYCTIGLTKQIQL